MSRYLRKSSLLTKQKYIDCITSNSFINIFKFIFKNTIRVKINLNQIFSKGNALKPTADDGALFA